MKSQNTPPGTKCSHCGANNEEDSRYCGKCGTPLWNPITPPEPSALQEFTDLLAKSIHRDDDGRKELLINRAEQIGRSVASIKTLEMARSIEKDARQFISELQGRRRELDQEIDALGSAFGRLDLSAQRQFQAHMTDLIKLKKGFGLSLDRQIASFENILTEIEQQNQSQTAISNLQVLFAKSKAWLQEKASWKRTRIEQINLDLGRMRTPEMARLVEKDIRQLILELEHEKRELDQMLVELEFAYQKLDLRERDALVQDWESLIQSLKRNRLEIDSQIVEEKRVIVGIEKQIQAQASGQNHEGAGVRLSSSSQQESSKKHQPTSDQSELPRTLEELLSELNSLVGLDAVKKDVAELINFLKVQQLRKTKGLPTAPMTLHHVFYGNPGTGKTTVARLLSQIFKSMNLLSKGHLIETDRSGLVAGYVGQTALKVTEVVNSALGGVLFIDEAYSLAGQGQDYGQEAIETLLKQMEDHRDDLVVIVAGYTDRMDQFLSSNPGLRSRFNKYLRFDDYTSAQLVAISELFCEKAGYHLSLAAKEKLLSVFSAAYDKRDKTFGNARFARNLFERTISNQANRVVALPDASLQTFSAIEIADIPDKVDDDLT